MCGLWEITRNGSADQTLIEHWDRQPHGAWYPALTWVSGNYLNGVAAVSANDVWAVGIIL